MAEGGYDPFHDREDDDYDDDDDDYDADETTPFLPGSASTPGPSGEEIQMKTMQKEKSGLPETSYAETSFGVRISDEDIQRGLNALRKNSTTGLLVTTKINPRVSPLNIEDREKEI